MRTRILALVLGVFLAIPCVLRADEVEIQLTEVIEISFMPIGDSPLDNPEQSPNVPTRPNNFRATINGNSLSIQKLETAIPSAQAIVVNSSTGNIVVNQQFTTTYQGQIANTGVYVLRIETAGGALVGQFVVQ